MKTLQDKATFYVPTETAEGQNMANEIADQASTLWGGASLTPGIGFYDSAKQEGVVRESVTLVTVFADRQVRAEWASWVKSAAIRIGIQLKQESVLVDVNGVGGLYESGTDY